MAIGLGLIDYRIVFCPHMVKVHINYIYQSVAESIHFTSIELHKQRAN